jgi:hypothetical protein
MANFLISAGINCGHEVIFTNEGLGVAKSKMLIYDGLDADASYMAAPYLKNEILNKAKIIHVVREPMKVINSFVVGYCYFLSGRLNCTPGLDWTYEYPPGADPEFKFMRFIYRHVPELYDVTLTPVERAALYYIKWNELIEQACIDRAFLFHPIESDISKLVNFIDAGDRKDLYGDINTNKAKYKNRFTLGSIPPGPIREKLMEIGRKYGYFRNVNLVL